MLEEGNDDETAAECQGPRLEKEDEQLAEDRARGARAGLREQRRDRHEGQRRRRPPPQGRPVIHDPDDPRRDEQERHFGPGGDRDGEACGRDDPLQPVFHPEPRQPVARMEDERDDGRTRPVEDRGHRRQTAEMDVQRGECRHDDEVREDEGPAAGPCPPEPSAEVGDEDPDLNRERAGQRLTDRDPLAHLLLRQPLPLLDQLSFHLAAERDRAAEPERAEAQVIPHQVPDPNACRGAGFRHELRLPSLTKTVQDRPHHHGITLRIRSSSRMGEPCPSRLLVAT